MGFLGFILLVFVAYVAYLFLRIVLGLKRAATRVQARPGPSRRDQGLMVKDEVCGTYIPREDALTEMRDGVERYFCSEECRRKGLAH
jgi:YHS domain-containing protein